MSSHNLNEIFSMRVEPDLVILGGPCRDVYQPKGKISVALQEESVGRGPDLFSGLAVLSQAAFDGS